MPSNVQETLIQRRCVPNHGWSHSTDVMCGFIPAINSMTTVTINNSIELWVLCVMERDKPLIVRSNLDATSNATTNYGSIGTQLFEHRIGTIQPRRPILHCHNIKSSYMATWHDYWLSSSAVNTNNLILEIGFAERQGISFLNVSQSTVSFSGEQLNICVSVALLLPLYRWLHD